MTEREARVERQGASELRQRPLVLTGRAEAQPRHHPGPGLAGIEGQSVLRVNGGLLVAGLHVGRPQAHRGPPDRPAQEGMGSCIARLQTDGTLQEQLCFLVLRPLYLVEEGHGPDHEAPGINAVRLLRRGSKSFLGIKVRFDRSDDPLSDVVLYGEDVLHLAVIFLGPDMLARGRVDELAGDANARSGSSDAALQDIPDPQIMGDLSDVHGLALVDEGGVPGDYEQPAQTCESRDDVLGDAIREKILLRIYPHVHEGQNSDGWLVERLQIRGLGRLAGRAVR